MAHEESFKPRGAMAFFALMMLLYAVMWLAVYLEVFSRR
ncbi:hypothetical protein HRbin21_00071 [bacterium HR21]|jgi:hypothetical protein|nr:hypothetical protein HRbin21_00071 [bacterium HR21]